MSKKCLWQKIFMDLQKKKGKKGKLRNIEKRWNEEYKTTSPFLSKNPLSRLNRVKDFSNAEMQEKGDTFYRGCFIEICLKRMHISIIDRSQGVTCSRNSVCLLSLLILIKFLILWCLLWCSSVQFISFNILVRIWWNQPGVGGGKRQAPIFKRRFGSNGNRFRACCGWLAISLPPPPFFTKTFRYNVPFLNLVVIRVILKKLSDISSRMRNIHRIMELLSSFMKQLVTRSATAKMEESKDGMKNSDQLKGEATVQLLKANH